MNSTTRLAAVAAFGLLISATDSAAQTCSCAGVPLLGSMELATPGDGQWFLASTYEYHDASDLVSGSSSVTDTTGRDRTTEVLMFETSRRLVGKLSFSALISTVKHDRTVGGVHDSASGLGDAIVLLKYSPMTISPFSRNAISAGVGVRLALGEDDATSSSGIVLAEDMQPSTGAFGSMVWFYAARALNEPATARLYASATYTNNDDNDRNYQFGNETTASFGASYQTQSPWGFNAELLYRKTERDKRASSTIPNTGGEWLDFVPAVQYHVNESLALRASAKIPVHRNLNDQLQFTTKYSFRLTLSYVFGN
jgi:hypothetical protein